MTVENLSNEYELQCIVKSILISRANKGATIAEIRGDYFSYYGEPFPYDDFKSIVEFLVAIPGVTFNINKNGTWLFNLVTTSSKTAHILKMVQSQKNDEKSSPKTAYTKSTPTNFTHGEHINVCKNTCFFKDNYRYQYKNYLCGGVHSSTKEYSKNFINYHNTSTNSSNSFLNRNDFTNFNKNGAYLYNYELIGDDFLLFLAKAELQCRLTPGHRVQQSGQCISGQTINDALKRVKNSVIKGAHVVINLGSVDILHGHDLLDIEEAYENFIEILESKGITPIITTLAPLANYGHRSTVKRNLERFNQFLRRHKNWFVIDLWKCMTNTNGHTLYECYQQEAKHVSGSNQPHVLWNKIGRQRILKYIKNRLSELQ